MTPDTDTPLSQHECDYYTPTMFANLARVTFWSVRVRHVQDLTPERFMLALELTAEEQDQCIVTTCKRLLMEVLSAADAKTIIAVIEQARVQ